MTVIVVLKDHLATLVDMAIERTKSTAQAKAIENAIRRRSRRRSQQSSRQRPTGAAAHAHARADALAHHADSTRHGRRDQIKSASKYKYFDK